MAFNKLNNKLTRALELLYGGAIPKKIHPLYEKIASSLADPLAFPLHVEEIVTHDDIKYLRFGLSRVQIDSELRMREDVEYNTQRLWIAQTIERMVFGGLIVEGEDLDGDEEDKD